VYDPDPRIARNLPLILGSYAVVLRELGLPLTFPGAPGHFTSLYQFTDSRILADAAEWMATTPSAKNQAYNVTNGDYFRWENVWPRIAEYFGMRPGGVRTAGIAETMAGHPGVWKSIVRRYGLIERDVFWRYADYVWRTEFDIMSSTAKARAAGSSASSIPRMQS
jgi:hypothetical protein